MTILRHPDDQSRPLFVYGLLKPGELAFSLVEPFVTGQMRAQVDGVLLLRDGIPLLDPAGSGRVCGSLLWFDPARLEHAWATVTSFEPSQHYKWGVTRARSEDSETVANVLLGRQLGAGTAGETRQVWSARDDPVFSEGLREVRRLVDETAPEGIAPQPDTPELWQRFFRLQAAYLLLWSIVERYTALRFGPGLEPWTRVKQLANDVSFREALSGVGIEPHVVVDSRDPSKRYRLAADGTGAAEFFYQVRSNLSHRGKSAFKDAQLVYNSATGLHAVLAILLDQQLPVGHSTGFPGHGRDEGGSCTMERSAAVDL